MGLSQKQVETWLRQLGSTPVEIEDKETEWHVRFDYPAKSPNSMHAIGPRGREGTLLIVFVLDVSHEHLKTFEDLDVDSQTTFLRDLRRTINVVEVDFRLEGLEKEGDCPKRIQFSVTRYADGLSMDSLARTVGAVFKTSLNTIWTVHEHLGHRDSGPGGRFDFRRLGY